MIIANPNNELTINISLGNAVSVTTITASEILGKLITVDGAGSGLDADKLDGREGDINPIANSLPLRDSEGSLSVNSMILSTTPNLSTIVNGETYYNTILKVFETKLPDGTTWQHGQEETVTVTNNSGSTIQDFTVIYWSSAIGASGVVRVLPFISNGTIESERCLGITTNDISNGNVGKVTSRGFINNVNTSGSQVGEIWTDGTVLYAHPTIAGGMTSVKPSYPNRLIRLGAVIRAHATTGIFFCRPTIYPAIVSTMSEGLMPKIMTNISSAPTVIGQTAIVGGVGYLAVGISSVTDWKQITN